MKKQLIILSSLLFLSCSNKHNAPTVEGYEEQSSHTGKVAQACGINRFIVFDNNSTVDSVVAYLANSHLSYEVRYNDEELRKEFNLRIPVTNLDPASDLYLEGCRCAKFIVVPIFLFGELRFKNALFIFYNNHLTNLVLQDVRKIDAQSTVIDLSEFYREKYGSGRKLNRSGRDEWVYENPEQNISLRFLTSEEEIDPNLHLYDKVSKEKLVYDMMNMSFKNQDSLRKCCSDWLKNQKKIDSIAHYKIWHEI